MDKKEISGFIHYKDANTKEIYFESINIDSKTYILNKVEDDLNKYMITMDGSNNIIDGSNNIIDVSNAIFNIIEIMDITASNKMMDTLSSKQNILIKNVKDNQYIYDFLNSTDASSNYLWVELKQNIETLNQLLKLQKLQTLDNSELTVVYKLTAKYKVRINKNTKSSKIIKTLIHLIHKDVENLINNTDYSNHKYLPYIINDLFFILKTLNINLINIFDNCELDSIDDLIKKCVNNKGINTDRVFFFTIIYNENEITDMHINNKSLHEALENKGDIIDEQLNSYINFLLKTDSTIDEKVTLIMDTFKTNDIDN